MLPRLGPPLLYYCYMPLERLMLKYVPWQQLQFVTRNVMFSNKLFSDYLVFTSILNVLVLK